ncbi:UDP-N-acetylmuramate--L-alanine ligase [Paramaledivibacter caminithermalis]|jgi:UDP-N-acetylmuramate--alanine ligase|uniref:UDP-N-acetylmuramate--L-alanine ligase n=1 Tax=Paramaledivibacter caminithermalis (strain DSM 15212 / CIP 107654 / DViRD3) TaxID=1121301 RepID=A0A1M6QMM5_PARC5|nr:UDP-N-acetylmuramate--L-alanine ligase [Paramaledivibacter caminithermalis]SHK21350.1 UDP-N-acetylmuramate--L-alanine ligase [Paramaledivibacter caminithermalis DSM 15212]
MLDFFNKKKGNKVHLIGIGGIGMSALAEILLDKGFIVSGSDIKSSHITKKLEEKGIKIYVGHSEDNVVDTDIVVYTSAVANDNPEIVKAKSLDIPVLDRAQMLGNLMSEYKTSIAVSGMHGKTTTTSMISLIFEHAQLNPTILVGGELTEIGGNVKIGSNDFLITEACEYKDNFLKFHPNVGVILNIDEDHLDYFKDFEHIVSTFSKFIKLLPKKGYVIVNNDDYNIRKLLPHAQCNIVTFGINIDSDFQAKNITFNESGYPSFDVVHKGKALERFTLSIPGKHNIYNALASIATAYTLEAPLDKIKEKLSCFKGTHRRFDILGELNNIKIIDDYAHHPTEIKATLDAAKKFPHNKIWCIFQPHTYSRTKSLLLDFAKSFKDADRILITDIYAAREKDTGEIHSKNLVELIEQEGHNVAYISSFQEIVRYLKEHAVPGDIVLTMGAGNIYKVGEMLLDKCV